MTLLRQGSAGLTTLADMEPVLEATDRLNAHARAFGCGKNAIYTYKAAIAHHMIARGAATARLVGVTVSCHSCGGTGRWRSWYDQSNTEPCRTCRRTGQVRLRFAETSIGAHRWHHPYSDIGSNLLRAAWNIIEYDFEGDPAIAVLRDGTKRPMIEEEPGDWAPNRPGERLPVEEAAALLNRVEDFIETLDEAHCVPYWYINESAHRAIASYRLVLGRVGSRCYRCSTSADLCNTARAHIGRWLEFARHICRACEAETPRIWPSDADVPPEALTPAIRQWLAHPRRQRANDR